MAEEAVGHERELKALGWHLSADGIAACAKQCKEKGWNVTTSNLKKIALDADLRSVGGGALSQDITRNLMSEVNGPIVLQIQRVKNVAVPSRKQHDPSPSKRLLRLQLTDGNVLVSAVECDGPINNLSPATSPGTKVKIIGGVAVQNSILLLNKTSLEVLGGEVEVLYKKWNTQKVLKDNASRTKVGSGTGPPPFVPFTGASKPSSVRDSAEVRPIGQSKKSSSSGYASKNAGASRSQQTHPRSLAASSRDSKKEQGREDKPLSEPRTRTSSKEREKREIDFEQSSKGAQGGRSVSEKEFESNYRSQRKEQQQPYQGRKTVESSAKGRGNGRQFKEPQRNQNRDEFEQDRGRREGPGRGRGRGQKEPDNYYRYPSSSDRFEHRVDQDMQRTNEPDFEGGRRGRGGRGRGREKGRGRGRRGRSYDDEDDYQPSTRPSGGHCLGDWFEQKLVLKDNTPQARIHSSHFGWYEEDYDEYYYEQEQPYVYEGSSSSREERGTYNKYDDYRENKDKHRSSSKQKSKTKVVPEEEEEEYPPMATKSRSVSGSQKSASANVEESHWDWVGLAAGSGAPSTATKK